RPFRLTSAHCKAHCSCRISHPTSFPVRRGSFGRFAVAVVVAVVPFPRRALLMRLRYRFILPLVAICMLAAATPMAAKAPHSDAIPQQTPVRIGTESTAATNCFMGVGSPTSGFTGGFSGLIFPPDDEYYTLVRRSDCVIDNCPAGVPIKLINLYA